MFLLTTFGAVALLLTAIGIYGVVAYGVSQRMREIGIRTALGAQASDVLKLVLREGMRPVLIGVVLGSVAALGITRVLASQLFGVGATDPATFATVWLVLVTVATAACWLPARRAACVDPMEALRHE